MGLYFIYFKKYWHKKKLAEAEVAEAETEITHLWEILDPPLNSAKKVCTWNERSVTDIELFMYSKKYWSSAVLSITYDSFHQYKWGQLTNLKTHNHFSLILITVLYHLGVFIKKMSAFVHMILQCSLRGFFRSGPTYPKKRTIWFDVGLRDGWRNELRYILVVCVGSIQLSPAQRYTYRCTGPSTLW